MVTDKFVKGYAVIKGKYISNNILDEYLHFIATIIKEEGMKVVDETVICDKLKEKYSANFQPTLIRQVLSNAMDKKLIIKDRERFIANSSVLEQYIIPKDDFDIRWNKLIDYFFTFIRNEKYSPKKAEVEEEIYNFIEAYDDRVLYNNIGDIDTSNSVFLYHWCNYILSLKDHDSEMYFFVLGLCSANLVKNTLFYTNQIKHSSVDLKVYLDTPMIFALLGMDTPERQESYKYILEKAKQVGMSLYVFDHNFVEVQGIMERASKWARSNEYDSSKANKVAQFFHDSDMDETEILEFISDTEYTLNSLGITKEYSAYLAEENSFQMDEQELFDSIKAEYGKRATKFKSEDLYDNSIMTDVRSIVMIQRKRAGNTAVLIQGARHVFVTTNSVIAKVSKDYMNQDETTKKKIPSSITADIFGTLLCLDFPDDNNNYLNLKMLADCKALLRPTPQMIAKFHIDLDNAYKKSAVGLTEEKFLFLRSHPIVQKKLLDVTTGDYSQFGDNTWREVYNRIESQAQFEGDKKYEEEKNKHNQTREILKSSEAKANEEHQKVADLQLLIFNRTENFSNALANIITPLIFGIPYLIITVAIILIQNEYAKLSLKGIIIAVTTVIFSILLASFYKKAKHYIKSRVKKHFVNKDKR